jgi:hypothetical protein
MRGDRVQRPPDPIIVEQFGLHPERFTDRPVPRPRPDMHLRRVGHQHFDHLPVSEFGPKDPHVRKTGPAQLRQPAHQALNDGNLLA